MGNILFPNIIKMPPQSSESQLYEVDIGIFHREALDSRNFFVLNPPPPLGEILNFVHLIQSTIPLVGVGVYPWCMPVTYA